MAKLGPIAGEWVESCRRWLGGAEAERFGDRGGAPGRYDQRFAANKLRVARDKMAVLYFGVNCDVDRFAEARQFLFNYCAGRLGSHVARRRPGRRFVIIRDSSRCPPVFLSASGSVRGRPGAIRASFELLIKKFRDDALDLGPLLSS